MSRTHVARWGQFSKNGRKYSYEVEVARYNFEMPDTLVEEEIVAITETVKATGVDPYGKKLFGIVAMASLLEKERFEELLAGRIIDRPENWHLCRTVTNGPS